MGRLNCPKLSLRLPQYRKTARTSNVGQDEILLPIGNRPLLWGVKCSLLPNKTA
jgi:hypothetical protein